MKIGAFALIFNSQQEVLISLRNDFNLWNLPGGGVEPREHRYVLVENIPENFSPNQKERIIDGLEGGVVLKEQSQSTITQELRQKVMIDKKFIYAIIGASNNPEKYGHKVMRDLLDGGYEVIPINPKDGEILGQKAYATIAEVPEKVDVAIMIVPSEIGLQVLPQIKEKGINKVWFQPGSESEEQIAYCKENNIQYIAGACIMIKRKQ